MATSDGLETRDWEMIGKLAPTVAYRFGASCDASLVRKGPLRALDTLV